MLRILFLRGIRKIVSEFVVDVKFLADGYRLLAVSSQYDFSTKNLLVRSQEML